MTLQPWEYGMSTRTVTSKEELKAAIEDKVSRITVKGDLAGKLNSAFKLKTASKWAIGLLGASLAASPFTAGISMAGALPIAALTGIEVAVVLAVAVVGIVLVLSVLRNYDKVIFKGGVGGAEGEITLERRRKQPSSTQ